MDKLQKIEQALYLSGMMAQLLSIVRSSDEVDFSDCPPKFIESYNDIARRCSGLMADIQNYIQTVFNGEGEE